MFAHSDDPDIDEPYQAPEGHTLGSSSTSESMQGVEPSVNPSKENTAGGDNDAEPQQAKSLKCDEYVSLFDAGHGKGLLCHMQKEKESQIRLDIHADCSVI